MNPICSNTQNEIFCNTLLEDSRLDPLNASLEEKKMILEAIDLIPCEQKQVVIDSIEVLLKNLECKATRKAILLKINDLPYEQRAKVVEYAASFCENLTDEMGREHIVQLVIEIPQEERSGFVSQAAHFCQNDTEGEEKVKILQAIKMILSKKKDDVLMKAAPFCQNLTEHWTPVILRIIETILAEQEDVVLMKATPLCQNFKEGKEKAAILYAIKAIPCEQRDNVLERTALICQGNSRAGISFMLKAIHMSLKEQREDVMQKAKSLDQCYKDREISGAILEAALFFPAEALDEFIKAISQAISKHIGKPFPSSTYYVGLALREDSALKEPLYQYLGNKLDSFTQAKEANLFTRVILNCQGYFMIDRRHWLVQKAIEKNLDSKLCLIM